MIQQAVLCPSGALPALRNGSAGPENHETSFVTALGCLAVGTHPQACEMGRRMLDFLERCKSTDQRGAFCFWPEGRRPDWARKVPADADDTALCLTALFRAGRRSRNEAIRQAVPVLLRHRQPPDPYIPDWVAPGAFRTWLAGGRDAPNPVDCAVNANILALFASLGMRDVPGTKAAVRTISDGLAWAGGDAVRLQTLTPFYPDPRELALALERAVAAGVDELRGPLATLRSVAPGLPGPDAILCCGAYLKDGWLSPALFALRMASTHSIYSQHEAHSL